MKITARKTRVEKTFQNQARIRRNVGMKGKSSKDHRIICIQAKSKLREHPVQPASNLQMKKLS